MSLHRTNNIYVKAFFDQEDLDHLQTGDEVKLKFPDGSTSRGFIKRFYFTTYTLPDEFQKKYEPTQRSLPADIYPVDTTELKKWRTYYKMTVEVLKPKF